MGTLFPDDPEYPDHKPLASLSHDVKEAAPTGALAVTIVAAAVVAEEPHIHHETEDPTPRSGQIEWVLSTSGPDVPFIPRDDSANMQIIRRHWQHRYAGFLAANAMSSTSSPALWIETGRRSTSE